MKIKSITVVDENDVTHTWEGVEGHVHIRAFTPKGKPYQQAVDAHLVLQAKPEPSA